MQESSENIQARTSESRWAHFARPDLQAVRPFIPELADQPLEYIKRVLGREKVAKLSFNENPYGPSPLALEAMQRATSRVGLYQDSQGTALREALAGQLNVNPEQLIITNGADEMIMLTAMAFLSPGDEVVIPSPTFGQYAASARVMGAVPVEVPLYDLKVSVKAILDAVNAQTKMVFLCNPNNPTGTILPGQDLKQLIRKLPGHIMLVVDEAYIDYVTSEDYASALEYLPDHPNVLIIRTFSKLHALAAARVGYGIGHPEIVALIHRVRPPFNANGIAQAGARASCQDQAYQQEMKEKNAANCKYLYAVLQELDIVYVPSQANFVLANVKRPASEVYAGLVKHGVIVRDATPFGLDSWLRITVGTRDELEMLQTGLHSLGFGR